MEDNSAVRGLPKFSKVESGGAAVTPEPVFGIVKNNADAIRTGRLEVYISGLCGDDPDNKDNWKKVNFLMPFYGLTPATGGQDGAGSYLQNPSSYGMWFSPPDIGTTVICVFIYGQLDYGFWIGCVPKPEALHTVPAIGASTNVIPNEGEANSYGAATRLPVTNINTNNPQIADSNDFLEKPKPIHSFQAGIYAQQGLIRDPIRGPISSSAQRESPSTVGFGVNTPGRPIYEGGFTDKNIDQNLDKKASSKLKIAGRRGGHSFVMDDGDLKGNDQLIRIRTALGHQIMMSDDGQCVHIIHSNGQSWIELGKEGTIDMYATNSINLRTQGDLNLHADNNININAAKGLNIAAGENIEVNTAKDMNFRIGGSFNNYTMGKYMIKVNGAMTMASDGPAGYASSAITYINGSKVNLNTGTAPVQPAEVKPIPIIAQTDTLHDEAKGWAAAPGKLMTIVSRAPAHAPWANANQGVDVKIDNSASSSLPPAPTPSVAAVNNAMPSPASPLSEAVLSTVPNLNAVSKAIDPSSTKALVGSMASAAAKDASFAVSNGIGTATDFAGKIVPAIGSFGLSPDQLEKANVLKSGAAVAVQAQLNAGKTIEAAMPSNLFTGKSGAENLAALVSNPAAQCASLVTNIQQAQSTLSKVGIIPSNGSQTAGLLQGAVSCGSAAVTDLVKNAGASFGGNLDIGNKLTNAIASGNYAEKLATTIPGIGNVRDAFASVTSDFVPMKPNMPQDLTAIAAGAAAKAGAKAAASAATALGAVTGSLIGKTSEIVGAAASATASSIGSMAAGLSGLSGGSSAAALVVNNGVNDLSKISGISAIGDTIKNSATSAVTGAMLSVGTSAVSKIGSALSDPAKSIADSVISALPTDQANKLASAISTVSSNGPNLPIVATNTNDRSTQMSQLVKTFGNSKIPVPDLFGSAASAASNAASAVGGDLSQITKNVTESIPQISDAKNALMDAKANLPAGDPGIAAAEAKYTEQATKLVDTAEKVASAPSLINKLI